MWSTWAPKTWGANRRSRDPTKLAGKREPTAEKKNNASWHKVPPPLAKAFPSPPVWRPESCKQTSHGPGCFGRSGRPFQSVIQIDYPTSSWSLIPTNVARAVLTRSLPKSSNWWNLTFTFLHTFSTLWKSRFLFKYRGVQPTHQHEGLTSNNFLIWNQVSWPSSVSPLVFAGAPPALHGRRPHWKRWPNHPEQRPHFEVKMAMPPNSTIDRP